MRRPRPFGIPVRPRCGASSSPSRAERWPQRGQGLVEYALMIVLITVVVLVILKTVTQK